jgi:CubicO group peptidase (beta-lactamase class C family)
MKKAFFIIIISLNVNLLIAQTSYSKEVEEQIKQVENNMATRIAINGNPSTIFDRMAHYNIKGVSIAVIQNYKMIWAKGYGWADEKEKRPVTEKTLFHAASISKSINGMAVLKLAQEKKLDLNADINKYLVTWKFPYDSASKGKKITTFNLLSHSGGLSNDLPNYFNTDTTPTLLQELNGMRPSIALPVHSMTQPGERFDYSNSGIGIAQLMVSDITQRAYADHIHQTILKPLNMQSSYYLQDSLKNNKQLLATGYDHGTEVPGKYTILPLQAAAGLWTTPSDLCNFICELQLAYNGKSRKILKQEMAKKMLTPYIDKVGLGVFIRSDGNEKYFEHSGRAMGFGCQYWASVEGGNGVVILTNSTNAASLIDEIAHSVAKVYNWKGFSYEPVMKNEITLPETVLAKYTGTYLFDSLLVTILKKDRDYYYISNGTYSKMHFASEKDFFNIEFTSEKTFLTDASGNINGFLRYLKGDTLTTAIKVNEVETLNAPFGQIGWVGWYYLENNDYENAIRYIKRSLVLNPNDINGVLNLAHCYLFKGEYSEALKLYKRYVDSGIEQPFVINKKNAVKQDFVLLQSKGFDKNLMDKVLADLKL